MLPTYANFYSLRLMAYNKAEANRREQCKQQKKISQRSFRGAKEADPSHPKVLIYDV